MPSVNIGASRSAAVSYCTRLRPSKPLLVTDAKRLGRPHPKQYEKPEGWGLRERPLSGFPVLGQGVSHRMAACVQPLRAVSGHRWAGFLAQRDSGTCTAGRGSHKMILAAGQGPDVDGSPSDDDSQCCVIRGDVVADQHITHSGTVVVMGSLHENASVCAGGDVVISGR